MAATVTEAVEKWKQAVRDGRAGELWRGEDARMWCGAPLGYLKQECPDALIDELWHSWSSVSMAHNKSGEQFAKMIHYVLNSRRKKRFFGLF